MSSWPFSYAPGGLVGFATDGLVALVDLPTDDELVARVAAIVAGDAPTLDAVLDVLVSRGLRAVETFGLAELGPDGARVLVRGACRAVGPDHAAASGPAGLWAESTWSGVTGVRLVVDGADARVLPLAGGIVLASMLGVGPDPAPTPVDVPPQPEPEPEPEPEPVAEPELAPEPDLELAPEPDLPEPEPEPEREPEPVGVEPGGATLASPLTGPVPSEADEPAAGAEPSASGTIIDALPWSFDDSALPVPPPAVVAVADEPAGHTADVAALRAQGGGPEALVVAVLCPDDHPNPVHATTCRACGAHLPAQQPVELPRPSLGVLRLDNGDVVALERGAVLGRNPRLPQGWTGEQPHLVRIDDPDRDVSSQHLEVRLDGWHVLVRDLGSTNGTEVTLPDSEPVLLRAHEQLSIEPGTRITLAGVFGVTYEASS